MNNKDFFIKVYAITTTMILGYMVLTGFSESKPENKFDEITVERINIVDPDGKLAMVLSNSERQHSGMMNGTTFQQRERPAGMIFFNKEGDEVGGLLYDGSEKEGAGMVLSFDQYKNDQIMQMQYMRTPSGKQKYGMNLWDRSNTITLPRLIHVIDSLKNVGVTDEEKMEDILINMNGGLPIGADRLFTGKNFDNQTGVFIKDVYGRDRIKLYIGTDDVPHFQILNEKGDLVKELIEK